MWTFILGLVTSLLPALLRLIGIGGKPPDVSRELGRAEQQNADMKADNATIRAANEAARKAEQETSDEPDPMDRANRR